MNFTLSGFADEAAPDIDGQIRAIQELGWKHISLRGIGGTNVHDLELDEVKEVAEKLGTAQLTVAEIGSLIGTWGKPIESDFQLTLDEVDRCIERAAILGTKMIRVMSYAQKPWGEDQQENERFRRLREITRRLDDAGLVAAHENCMNWGGFSAEHTLRLLDEVAGLKLVFDTGNPVFQRDRSKPQVDGLHPWQDALEFYQKVRHAVVHIHIKDCRNPLPSEDEPEYTFPGEGQADVPAILGDLLESGYRGICAIEPHVATVFHLRDGEQPDWRQCHESFVEYGRRIEALADSIAHP